MSQKFFERHQPLLEQALAAAALRGYWSPFAESPSPRNYGETANDDGRAAFDPTDAAARIGEALATALAAEGLHAEPLLPASEAF